MKPNLDNSAAKLARLPGRFRHYLTNLSPALAGPPQCGKDQPQINFFIKEIEKLIVSVLLIS
jgi:hypothetical protein